jgi:FlaA1/EpsC-like NDP-sugar epimerase
MNYQKRIIFLNIVDALIIAAAVALAYLLRFDFQIQEYYFNYLPFVAISHIVLVLIIFNMTKMYRKVWQYASIGELVSLVKAVTMAEILFSLLTIIVHTYSPDFTVPRSIYLLSWVLIIIGVGGARFSWRMFRDSYMKSSERTYNRRTLIIGAGSAGVLIAKELKHAVNPELYPFAFIDDDRTKWKMQVMGMPVLGGRDQISEAVKKYSIEKIIIAMPSSTKSETAKIINLCKNTGAKIRILPRVGDLINMNISLSMIREVNVEDLLGRDPVQVDLNGIADYVTGKVVLVTGAGGSIGSELCRQIAPFSPKRLLILGRGENSIYDIEIELRKSFPTLEIDTIIADIKDRHLIRDVLFSYRPSVVFHAAAHKHVPLMERNPVEAVKNNILGTINLAEGAHEAGISRFVMISTDKAVNPTSVMGVTKRIAEIYVQGLARSSRTKFVAVRFGNVLGSRGSVIPVFKKQIQEGGPITVTDSEMVRYFMTIPEAVQLVIQAGAFAKGGEIFILDMGKPVKIADLARDLIRLSGLEPDVDIKIEYTGIRPGEKLFEEILTNEEGISATKHNRIFVGKPVDFSLEEIQFMIRKMEQVVNGKDVQNRGYEVKNLLKQIVPSFHGPSIDNISGKSVQLSLVNKLQQGAAGIDKPKNKA